MNASYVSNLFKKKTGENISDYILRIRIKKAKELMKSPEYKIYMIAEAVGFTDEKYFSKVFKDVTGMSPNQYRKKIKKGVDICRNIVHNNTSQRHVL